ncbi:MAG: carbohydrate kinase family protein [Chloroflexota bacterium]|nr:carbohydrate kinase family protein [Chloroflexota bacterium]
MNYKKAVISGYLCLDITTSVHGSTRVSPGRKAPIKIGGVVFNAGGIANLALALHHLGVPTTLVGKVGDDPFGYILIKAVKDNGSSLVDGLILDPSAPTGYNLKIGETRYYFPGANKSFYASDLHRDLLREADLFHFSCPALMRSIYRGDGGELVSILQRVRREGLSTSLNFGLPDLYADDAGGVDWSLLLANALPLVDVFAADLAQFLFFFKPDLDQQALADGRADLVDRVTPELLHELSETVMGYGVKILMVNLGKRGLYLRTNGPKAWKKQGRGLSGLGEDWVDREIWPQAFEVGKWEDFNVYDHGVAGFLAGLLGDSDPETALKLAGAATAHYNQGALRGFWDSHPEIRRAMVASS